MPIVFSSYGQILTRDGKVIPPDKRDTNFVSRLKMQIVHDYEVSPKDGDWQAARISDLKAWRDYYRALAAKMNEFPVAPEPQSPAADVLLALSNTVRRLKNCEKRASCVTRGFRLITILMIRRKFYFHTWPF